MAEYPIWEQVNNNAGTTMKPVVSPTVITAAATIAPTYRVSHVTGATPIATITPPWTPDFGGTIVLISDSAFSWTAGGNIQSVGSVGAAGVPTFFTFDPIQAKWFPANTVSGTIATGAASPQTIRVRTTTANVNTGATLLPAVTGLKYRLTDIAVISIGGAAATATTVDIKGTQASSVVKLFAIPVASLVQTAVVKPGTIAASGPLADGACFQQCDVSTAITIGSTTNNLSGSTNIDAILTFVLEL